MKTTINGFTLSHARRMAELEFGDELIKVRHNIAIDKYDIYVREPVDITTKLKFKRFWPGVFRIIPINGCKTNTDIEKAWVAKIESIEKRKQVRKNKKENIVIKNWEDPFFPKPKKIDSSLCKKPAKHINYFAQGGCIIKK